MKGPREDDRGVGAMGLRKPVKCFLDVGRKKRRSLGCDSVQTEFTQLARGSCQLAPPLMLQNLPHQRRLEIANLAS